MYYKMVVFRWAGGFEEGATGKWEGGFSHHGCTGNQDPAAAEPPQYSQPEGDCHRQAGCTWLQERQR